MSTETYALLLPARCLARPSMRPPPSARSLAHCRIIHVLIDHPDPRQELAHHLLIAHLVGQRKACPAYRNAVYNLLFRNKRRWT